MIKKKVLQKTWLWSFTLDQKPKNTFDNQHKHINYIDLNEFAWLEVNVIRFIRIYILNFQGILSNPGPKYDFIDHYLKHANLFKFKFLSHLCTRRKNTKKIVLLVAKGICKVFWKIIRAYL